MVESVFLAVALTEALAVCEREPVVVRVEDTLVVAVRVGTVVQDAVAVVVDVFEGGVEAERLEDADALRLGCIELLVVDVPEGVRVPCVLREAVVVAEALRDGRVVSVICGEAVVVLDALAVAVPLRVEVVVRLVVELAVAVREGCIVAVHGPDAVDVLDGKAVAVVLRLVRGLVVATAESVNCSEGRAERVAVDVLVAVRLDVAVKVGKIASTMSVRPEDA